MSDTGKKQYTRNEIARFRAINARKRLAAQATGGSGSAGGEQEQKPRQFKLQDVKPFDQIISFTDASRGMTRSDDSRAFATLKGVKFVVDDVAYERTCMAYGPAADAVNALIDAGETMLEVELTFNYNTMLITGVVVDGEFMSFPKGEPQKEAAAKAA